MAIKARNPEANILAVVHESITGLHKIGLVD